MDIFAINDQTKYWIYPITAKAWDEYAKYLEDQDSWYICSFKPFSVKS